MKHLLYLSPTERQFWQKTTRGWAPSSEIPQGHVWVVTDFPDESITEVKAPRLMSRDREAFTARQLNTRYPDTVYRGIMPALDAQSLLDKLMPTRHVAYALETPERLDQELAQTGISCAGVWPISMLLADYGRQRQLPTDLFLVLPAPDFLRIVFVHAGTPILTRLTNTENEPEAQVEEILRTVKYLENSNVLARDSGKRHILYFGEQQLMREAASRARLELVPPVGLKNQPTDWRFPLFDLALTSPAGQLAPLEMRTRYLGERLNKTSKLIALICVLVGVAVAGLNLATIMESRAEQSEIAAQNQVAMKTAGDADEALMYFNVSPDTVRQAIALHEQEIGSVPGMREQAQQLAEVLSATPQARLSSLRWRLLAPQALPCDVSAEVMDQLQQTTPDVYPANQRHIEINVGVSLPASYGPRDRALSIRRLADNMADWPRAHLWRDAAQSLSGSALTGSSDKSDEKTSTWCLTLPGVKATSPLHTDSAPSDSASVGAGT
jgi:hypothetical protein